MTKKMRKMRKKTVLLDFSAEIVKGEQAMESEEFWQDMRAFISRNKKEIIGALLGLLIGLFILYLGLLRTIIIAIFTLLGFLIGSRDELKDDIKSIIDRILPV